MTKKILRYFLLVFSLSLLLFTMLSCSDDEKYNVIFTVDGETYATVAIGSKNPAMPEDPEKSGYEFTGWIFEAEKTEFTEDMLLGITLTEDITVTAQWQHIHTTFKTVTVKDATCFEEGVAHKLCDVCNELVEVLTVDKTEHTPVTDSAVEPTDLDNGLTEGSHCSVCNKIIVAQDIIPAFISGTGIKSESLTLTGSLLKATFPNSTLSFSFLNDITVARRSSYILSRDENGTSQINSKTVALDEGDNIYYIIVSYGEISRTYAVKIRRLPMLTVSFDSNGGSTVSPQNIEEGSLATSPEPTKQGYDFAGWGYDFSIPVTESLQLTASWTPRDDTPYTTEYYVKNENGEYVLRETVKLTAVTDSTVNAIEKVYEYYTLDDTVGIKSGTVLSDGSLLLKLYYERSHYKVSFVTDSINGLSLEPIMVKKNTAIGTLEGLPKKDGSAIRWITDDGQTVWHLHQDTVTEDMTLTAEWATAYTVTFKTNSKTGSEIEDQTVAEGDTIVPVTPTNGNFQFKGWYIVGTNKKVKWSYTDPITSDLSLEADWIFITPPDMFG